MPAQKYADKFTIKGISMEPVTIPANNSQQHLMNDIDAVDIVPNLLNRNESENRINKITFRHWTTVIVLCYVNLINYMDRYTLAGVLKDVQTAFNINDSYGGLLQTVFVISYMIFAPLFGYLGDRYSRKWLMAFGVALWSIMTVVGSFMTEYKTFLLFRALVGIGEASYSTIAPTIISDLFVSDLRSKMLALFYFAIPVGSGLGYITGASAKYVFGDWTYALRITPCLGIVAVILIIFVLVDPARGEIEGRGQLKAGGYFKDIESLTKNKSFMFSTLGFTCVAFVTGALAWWGPKFIALGQKIATRSPDEETTDVTTKFGLTAMLAGGIGVPLGSFLASKAKHYYSVKTDPWICGSSVTLSLIFLIPSLSITPNGSVLPYILIFFAEVFINFTWAIVSDMVLYVVIPTRRSSAEAFQILISHALGDAGSPYLVGVISDALKFSVGGDNTVQAEDTNTEVDFRTLQYALFTTCFIEIIGAICFLITSFYIVDDRELAIIEGEALEKTNEPANHMYADDPRLSSSEANLTVTP